jgi:hypothetical protein
MPAAVPHTTKKSLPSDATRATPENSGAKSSGGTSRGLPFASMRLASS